MYDKTLIKNLYDVNGWRQSPLAAYAIIDSSNQSTSSGLYYQDFSPLVTIENIYNSAPEGLSDVNFNTWLKNLTKASVIKVVNTLLQRQRPKSKDLLENFRLFNHENRLESGNLIPAGTDTVGFEIELNDANHLRLFIDSIGLMLNGTQALTVRVFHSHSSTALHGIAASGVSCGEKWVDLAGDTEVSMYNFNASAHSGGKFYVCYRQSDLGSNQAYDREFEYANIQRCARFFTIRPFKVAGWDETTRFDVEDVEYTSETWGMNFELTTHIDLTRFFTVHKSTIANLLGLQVAVDVLELLANTTRTHPLKTELRERADYELNLPNVGLRDRLEKEMKAVDIDISGLDVLALPEKDKTRSITMR